MKRSLAPLALVCAVVPRIALAQDPPPPVQDPSASAQGVGAPPSGPPAKDDAKEIEVRVVGNHADALQKIPGSGTVIGSKDLERAQPVDSAEMLRRVPGVQVREEYSGGSRLDISIRGLESGRSRRVLMLEDGVPMALNPYQEPDMNYAPAIERYRAIEVVKGSGNILFGPQTLAGTINFVTIAPPDHRQVKLDVDAGTYGYARGLASYGDTIGDVRYVVQFVQRHGDGFRNQPFDSSDGLGKIIFPTGKDGELMVRLSWRRDQASSDDVGLTSAMYAADPRRDTLAPHDQLIFDKYDLALVHEQRFSDDTKLKTLIYADDQPRIWRRQDWTRSPTAGQSYERIVGDVNAPMGAIYFQNTDTVLDRDYQVQGVEPRAEHRMRTGPIEHTIDFGGRVLHESAHYDQRSGTTPDSYAGSNDFEEKHDGIGLAAYVQDRIVFTDKLLVTPGIRFEHYEFRRDIIRQNVGSGVVDSNAEGSQSGNGVIPGLGAIYGTKAANVFAGMHVGFAPPRVTSAISAKGVPSDVHAEQSINYEAGSRVSPTKWLRVEATGFLSDFSNQVIVGTEPGGDASLSDAGETNIVGVESGLVLGIGKMLALPALVEAGVRYTFSRATFRHGPDQGHLLPYAPEHTVSANLDFEHESGFGGQLAYWFVSAQFTDGDNTRTQDPAGDVGPLDPWHVVDATVHYHHKPSHLTVRLTAKNLLDTTYIDARRPNGIFPGPYRQLLLGLRWEWDGARHDEVKQ